ncbi:MAG: hypothetical protein ABI565_07980 [Vicinamibacteria bacterium]
MNSHQHLSTEEIFERLSAGEPVPDLGGCAACEAEASSLSGFLSELGRVDAELVATTEWDDLLLRRRIREAIAKEKPHVRSIFDRFLILKPALVTALVASLALVAWSPFSPFAGRGSRAAAGALVEGRIPSWTPLPAESEDEGLAVLAEWTPNEDEVAIARCHFACLSGLSAHEEDHLLLSASLNNSRSPPKEASPL